MQLQKGALVVATFLGLALIGSMTKVEGQTASPSLDYEFFKTKVQPIFLTKRDGHARCVACHTVNNAPFKLVPLSPGAATWNEQQSRMNFELVKRVAMPGFLESKLLIHPLAEEAGGDDHHGGAQQFSSKQDPAWQILRAFVMGETVK
jgi:hypothetical protein